MFLAIAVDNLADAENLTRIEHEQERVRKEKKKKKLQRKKGPGAIESHSSIPELNGNTLVGDDWIAMDAKLAVASLLQCVT